MPPKKPRTRRTTTIVIEDDPPAPSTRKQSDSSGSSALGSAGGGDDRQQNQQLSSMLRPRPPAAAGPVAVGRATSSKASKQQQFSERIAVPTMTVTDTSVRSHTPVTRVEDPLSTATATGSGGVFSPISPEQLNSSRPTSPLAMLYSGTSPFASDLPHPQGPGAASLGGFGSGRIGASAGSTSSGGFGGAGAMSSTMFSSTPSTSGIMLSGQQQHSSMRSPTSATSSSSFSQQGSPSRHQPNSTTSSGGDSQQGNKTGSGSGMLFPTVVAPPSSSSIRDDAGGGPLTGRSRSIRGIDRKQSSRRGHGGGHQLNTGSIGGGSSGGVTPQSTALFVNRAASFRATKGNIGRYKSRRKLREMFLQSAIRIAVRAICVVNKFRRILARIRANHHTQTVLVPRAAFKIQCIFRKHLQRSRVHRISAAFSIKTFILRYMQRFFARRNRWTAAIQRLCRGYQGRVLVATLKRSKEMALVKRVVRKAMTVVYARRIKDRLGMERAEKSLIVVENIRVAHQILRQERLERVALWKSLSACIESAISEMHTMVALSVPPEDPFEGAMSRSSNSEHSHLFASSGGSLLLPQEGAGSEDPSFHLLDEHSGHHSSTEISNLQKSLGSSSKRDDDDDDVGSDSSDLGDGLDQTLVLTTSSTPRGPVDGDHDHLNVPTMKHRHHHHHHESHTAEQNRHVEFVLGVAQEVSYLTTLQKRCCQLASVVSHFSLFQQHSTTDAAVAQSVSQHPDDSDAYLPPLLGIVPTEDVGGTSSATKNAQVVVQMAHDSLGMHSVSGMLDDFTPRRAWEENTNPAGSSFADNPLEDLHGRELEEDAHQNGGDCSKQQLGTTTDAAEYLRDLFIGTQWRKNDVFVSWNEALESKAPTVAVKETKTSVAQQMVAEIGGHSHNDHQLQSSVGTGGQDSARDGGGGGLVVHISTAVSGVTSSSTNRPFSSASETSRSTPGTTTSAAPVQLPLGGSASSGERPQMSANAAVGRLGSISSGAGSGSSTEGVAADLPDAFSRSTTVGTSAGSASTTKVSLDILPLNGSSSLEPTGLQSASFPAQSASGPTPPLTCALKAPSRATSSSSTGSGGHAHSVAGVPEFVPPDVDHSPSTRGVLDTVLGSPSQTMPTVIHSSATEDDASSSPPAVGRASLDVVSPSGVREVVSETYPSSSPTSGQPARLSLPFTTDPPPLQAFKIPVAAAGQLSPFSGVPLVPSPAHSANSQQDSPAVAPVGLHPPAPEPGKVATDDVVVLDLLRGSGGGPLPSPAKTKSPSFHPMPSPSSGSPKASGSHSRSSRALKKQLSALIPGISKQKSYRIVRLDLSKPGYEVALAFAKLLCQTESIERKLLQQDIMETLRDMHSQMEWILCILVYREEVHPMYVPLLHDLQPTWSLVRGVRILLEEEVGREKIIDEYDSTPLLHLNRPLLDVAAEERRQRVKETLISSAARRRSSFHHMPSSVGQQQGQHHDTGTRAGGNAPRYSVADAGVMPGSFRGRKLSFLSAEDSTFMQLRRERSGSNSGHTGFGHVSFGSEVQKSVIFDVEELPSAEVSPMSAADASKKKVHGHAPVHKSDLAVPRRRSTVAPGVLLETHSTSAPGISLPSVPSGGQSYRSARRPTLGINPLTGSPCTSGLPLPSATPQSDVDSLSSGDDGTPRRGGPPRGGSGRRPPMRHNTQRQREQSLFSVEPIETFNNRKKETEAAFRLQPTVTGGVAPSDFYAAKPKNVMTRRSSNKLSVAEANALFPTNYTASTDSQTAYEMYNAVSMKRGSSIDHQRGSEASERLSIPGNLLELFHRNSSVSSQCSAQSHPFGNSLSSQAESPSPTAARFANEYKHVQRSVATSSAPAPKAQRVHRVSQSAASGTNGGGVTPGGDSAASVFEEPLPSASPASKAAQLLSPNNQVLSPFLAVPTSW